MALDSNHSSGEEGEEEEEAKCEFHGETGPKRSEEGLLLLKSD